MSSRVVGSALKHTRIIGYPAVCFITVTTYLLVDAGAPDVDASVDVFLEQTKNGAAAGLVFQASDSGHMQRFLLQTKGPAFEARIDSIVAGTYTGRTLAEPDGEARAHLAGRGEGGDLLHFPNEPIQLRPR